MESFETKMKIWAAKMKERDERWAEQTKYLQAMQEQRDRWFDNYRMEQDQWRKKQKEAAHDLEVAITTSINSLAEAMGIQSPKWNQPAGSGLISGGAMSSPAFGSGSMEVSPSSLCGTTFSAANVTGQPALGYLSSVANSAPSLAQSSFSFNAAVQTQDCGGFACSAYLGGTIKGEVKVYDEMPSLKSISHPSQGAAQQEYELLPTSQVGYGSQAAKAKLRKGLVRDAIRADDATQFLVFIHAAEQANVNNDWERNSQMVRQKANEPKVDSELIFAYAEIDRLGEIKEFILRPTMANLQNVVQLIEQPKQETTVAACQDNFEGIILKREEIVVVFDPDGSEDYRCSSFLGTRMFSRGRNCHVLSNLLIIS